VLCARARGRRGAPPPPPAAARACARGGAGAAAAGPVPAGGRLCVRLDGSGRGEQMQHILSLSPKTGRSGAGVFDLKFGVNETFPGKVQNPGDGAV